MQRQKPTQQAKAPHKQAAEEENLPSQAESLSAPEQLTQALRNPSATTLQLQVMRTLQHTHGNHFVTGLASQAGLSKPFASLSSLQREPNGDIADAGAPDAGAPDAGVAQTDAPDAGSPEAEHTEAKQQTHEEPNEFEKHMLQNYDAVCDEVTGEIIGYYKSNSGYQEIRDVYGKYVWSSEIPLETPLLDPIDLIPFGAITKIGVGVAKGLARVIILSAVKQAGKSASRALGAELLKILRSIAATTIGKIITTKAEASVAQKAAATLTQTIAESLASKGASKAVTVEGVAVSGIRALLHKGELRFSYTIIENVSKIPNRGKLIQSAMERAAIEVARQNKASVARVSVELVQNPRWGEYLLSRGYAVEVLENVGEVGFTKVWTKVFSL